MALFAISFWQGKKDLFTGVVSVKGEKNVVSLKTFAAVGVRPEVGPTIIIYYVADREDTSFLLIERIYIYIYVIVNNIYI